MRRSIRLGLLAAARITKPAVIEAARVVGGVEPAAVAARSLERATAAATEWDVPRAYGTYEELIEDPDVDAIYVATPAALHCRWTLAALAAGKDVLCEKPLAANADEAREMTAAAADAGRILMEAFHWRYHPMVEVIGELLAGGRLGVLRQVHGAFVVPEGHIGRTDIRWQLALGGGALMDLGCYPLQWVRWAVGLGEPEVVSARAECPEPGVDGHFTAELAWPSGVTGSIECSMMAPGGHRADLELIGDAATAVVVNLLAPQHGASLELHTASGNEELALPCLDTTTYQHQLAAFVEAVTTRRPPITSGEDSVATMALIDACYIAAGLEPRPSLGHPSSTDPSALAAGR